jgi:hypothetical protein
VERLCRGEGTGDGEEAVGLGGAVPRLREAGLHLDPVAPREGREEQAEPGEALPGGDAEGPEVLEGGPERREGPPSSRGSGDATMARWSPKAPRISSRPAVPLLLEKFAAAAATKAAGPGRSL